MVEGYELMSYSSWVTKFFEEEVKHRFNEELHMKLKALMNLAYEEGVLQGMMKKLQNGVN